MLLRGFFSDCYLNNQVKFNLYFVANQILIIFVIYRHLAQDYKFKFIISFENFKEINLFVIISKYYILKDVNINKTFN